MTTDNSTLTESPITFSENAIKELQRLILNKKEDTHLRIGVKGGGCSGMTYVLEFGAQQENDKVFEYKSIPFFVQPSHLLYLKGMEVNYDSGLNARGFTFSNPNATKTCGCGTSFAV